MWRCVALATAGPVACGAAVLLLQPAIGRTLNGGDALPSGHTTAAVCTAMVVLLVGPRLAGRRVPRVAGAPVVVAVTVIMGTTLITNGLHVPSDILAGAVAGVAGVLSTAFLIDRIAERQHAKGPRISD
nr:phosphatase PAP2 family protein [Pseudonocardia sp. C8]